jgi:RNA polymerase sigma-54 factor
MNHGTDTSLRQRTGVNLRIDPKVVLASRLLQCNRAQLEEALEAELAENPALERLDDTGEPVDTVRALKAVAPEELRPSGEDYEVRRSLPAGTFEEGVDWLELARAPESLADHLTAQMALRVPPRLARAVETLVGSLDDRGYLAAPVEELALQAGVSIDDAQELVRLLKGCEPAGVGARNLRECLWLQLRGTTGFYEALARAILAKRFDDLVANNLRAIARAFRVLPEVVEQALAVIRSLRPNPVEGFPAGGHRPLPAEAATPDLILRYRATGWLVEVHGPGPEALAVSRAYRERLEAARGLRSVPPSERRHCAEYVSRAERFIEALEQRRRTIRRIGEHLIERQTGFIATGDCRFLQPMTRARIAQGIGAHESTVSRATQGKFVQIATGEVVAFDVFFRPALRVQQMIAEILATENPASPLSDEAISRALAGRGVPVARRTVNKYRDRNRVLSSRRRKSA